MTPGLQICYLFIGILVSALLATQIGQVSRLGKSMEKLENTFKEYCTKQSAEDKERDIRAQDISDKFIALKTEHNRIVHCYGGVDREHI